MAIRNRSHSCNVKSDMGRCLALCLLVLTAAACGSISVPVPTPPAGMFSCQPFGYPPAPVSFSLTPGPVTSSGAEQMALALFRACAASTTNGEPTAAITNIATDIQAATGHRSGPNTGQPVWLVRIDVTLRDSPAQIHSWTEVNQATGVPTIVALG